MITENIILKKNVFWSMLEHELTIPIESQLIYRAVTGKNLEVGGKHNITLIIDGQMFEAYFRNEGFNRTTFNHDNIIMLSYGKEVKKKLQELFHVSYNLFKDQREEYRRQNPSGRIYIDTETDESFLLYATSDPDVFAIDCVTHDMFCDVQNDIASVNEEIFEQIDDNAGITLSNSVHKIRVLDRSIGNSLKKLYDYRCQMSGEKIGDGYNVCVVEAHHIEPFTQSLNNNSSNIIILSPSYHRIIHKAKPIWLPDQKAFSYPNGFVEKVKLNIHL